MPTKKAKLPAQVNASARVYSVGYLESLVAIMREPKTAPTVRVAAAHVLLDLGWAKPGQHVAGGDAAKRIGRSSTTVANYIARYPARAEVERKVLESNLDFAEAKLMASIEGGNVSAITFYLSTRGKGRGYVRRNEIAGGTDGPVELYMRMDPASRRELIAEKSALLGSVNPLETHGKANGKQVDGKATGGGDCTAKDDGKTRRVGSGES